MGAYLIGILVPLYLVGAYVAVTWIKTRYARPSATELQRPLDDLTERIEVLERILTDRRGQLAREIERLGR